MLNGALGLKAGGQHTPSLGLFSPLPLPLGASPAFPFCNIWYLIFLLNILVFRSEKVQRKIYLLFVQ